MKPVYKAITVQIPQGDTISAPVEIGTNVPIFLFTPDVDAGDAGVLTFLGGFTALEAAEAPFALMDKDLNPLPSRMTMAATAGWHRVPEPLCEGFPFLVIHASKAQAVADCNMIMVVRTPEIFAETNYGPSAYPLELPSAHPGDGGGGGGRK